MAKCMACNKTVLLTKSFDNIVLCNNCANLIEFSSWEKRMFSSMNELVERKKHIIELAKNNGIKKEIEEQIEKYFDEYINNGFITSMNGKAGQVLKVFSDYCIVSTKNETAKNSLENTFYQFGGTYDESEDVDEDDEENITLSDKKKIVQGLMSGKIIQTGMAGIGVAMSASLKENEKEKKAAQKAREKRKKLEKIIKVGDKTIYLNNISEVEIFSKNNIVNGYLKFVPNGISINNSYACEYFFFNNSIPFESRRIKKQVESICNILSGKIDKIKDNKMQEQEKQKLEEIIKQKNVKEEKNLDAFEEIRKYKQLLDEGILTEEEFNIKKKELLNV